MVGSADWSNQMVMKQAQRPAPTYISPAQVWPTDGKRLAEVSNPYGFLPVTEEILAEIVRRIVAQFDPEKIILFGSYAYGQPNQDSDVDLLVIMDQPISETERYLAVCRVLRPRPFPMDILVKTTDEITDAIKRNHFFLTEIVNQGKVLYERSGRSAELGGEG